MTAVGIGVSVGVGDGVAVPNASAVPAREVSLALESIVGTAWVFRAQAAIISSSTHMAKKQ